MRIPGSSCLAALVAYVAVACGEPDRKAHYTLKAVFEPRDGGEGRSAGCWQIGDPTPQTSGFATGSIWRHAAVMNEDDITVYELAVSENGPIDRGGTMLGFWRHDEKMARSKTDIAAEFTLSSGRTFDVHITGFFERDEECAAE